MVAAATPGSAVKDVQAQLIKERKRIRRPGVSYVPYPLKYSRALTNFDHWDFQLFCSQSLTIHQFTEPPRAVLDLGCGSGYWIIEAARQWQYSTFIGFDIQKIQPPLHKLEPYRDIAGRITWVHGNILEKLPFVPNQFDFVRISGIGLGVPEDEWQFVLEEIARVLKPGCAIEIIEEDLIFPCADPPKPKAPPQLSVDTARSMRQRSRSKSSNITATTPTSYASTASRSTTLSDRTLSGSDKTSLFSWQRTSVYEDIPPIPPMPAMPFPYRDSYAPPGIEFGELPSPSPESSSSGEFIDRGGSGDEVVLDGQDHSKLKASWHAMLSSRFLPSGLVSVLHFYLSSIFEDVKSSPALRVPLPPNSSAISQSKNGSNAGALPGERESMLGTHFFDISNVGRKSSSSDSTIAVPSGPHSRSASLHLAKTVQTITACKEAIWEQFDKLFGEELKRQTVTRLIRQNRQIEVEHAATGVREEFERLWCNWNHDMMDRIAARDLVRADLGWDEPLGENPVWRVWRNAVAKTDKYVADATPGDAPTPLCRSVRGFVGWTPPDESHSESSSDL